MREQLFRSLLIKAGLQLSDYADSVSCEELLKVYIYQSGTSWGKAPICGSIKNVLELGYKNNAVVVGNVDGVRGKVRWFKIPMQQNDIPLDVMNVVNSYRNRISLLMRTGEAVGLEPENGMFFACFNDFMFIGFDLALLDDRENFLQSVMDDIVWGDRDGSQIREFFRKNFFPNIEQFNRETELKMIALAVEQLTDVKPILADKNTSPIVSLIQAAALTEGRHYLHDKDTDGKVLRELLLGVVDDIAEIQFLDDRVYRKLKEYSESIFAVEVLKNDSGELAVKAYYDPRLQAANVINTAIANVLTTTVREHLPAVLENTVHDDSLERVIKATEASLGERLKVVSNIVERELLDTL